MCKCDINKAYPTSLAKDEALEMDLGELTTSSSVSDLYKNDSRLPAPWPPYPMPLCRTTPGNPALPSRGVRPPDPA